MPNEGLYNPGATLLLFFLDIYNIIILKFVVQNMLVRQIVLILYGKSEIGAHVRSDLGYLICLSHLIRSRAVTNWK